MSISHSNRSPKTTLKTALSQVLKYIPKLKVRAWILRTLSPFQDLPQHYFNVIDI